VVDGAALEKRCAKAPRVRIPPSPPHPPARRDGGRCVRCRLRSSLTYLRVRSLRSSAPPSPRPPSRRADVTCPWRGTGPGARGAASRYPALLGERSPSGLWRRTGNAVWGNPSRVRIPPSPPHPAKHLTRIHALAPPGSWSRTSECARCDPHGAGLRLRHPCAWRSVADARCGVFGAQRQDGSSEVVQGLGQPRDLGLVFIRSDRRRLERAYPASKLRLLLETRSARRRPTRWDRRLSKREDEELDALFGRAEVCEIEPCWSLPPSRTDATARR
jgi:hypothetical protein